MTDLKDLETITYKIQTFAHTRNEILAVYLFGSSLVRDRPRDLDIALLVRRGPPDHAVRAGEMSAFGYRATVTSEFMQLLGKNEIDVILLHEASPLLCKEILRKGKLIYSDPGYDRVRMEKQLMDRYLDTAPLRRIKEHYLKQRYLGHD